MATLAAAVILVGVLPATFAGAQQVQILTDYPFVSVEAGKTASFDVQVITPSRERVRLDVVEAPRGWRVTLRGGGFVVHGVFGAPENGPRVQAEVQVPEDAARGDHRVVIRATSATGATDSLGLVLRVAETVAGAVTLTADFPRLRGASDTTFNYSLTLTNNSPEETNFNLIAQGPEGWVVQARPSQQEQAATLRVDGGSTGSLTVDVDPPDDVAAGTYEVVVRAEGGNKSAETTLETEIIGNVVLTVTTPDERLNAEVVAGRERDITILVVNDGSTAVEQVTLSATPPSDWEVTFEPETIERIDAGGTAEVTAKISPSGEAVAGDYALTMSAAAEAATDDVELRVTVRTSRLWGLVGIVVILAVGFLLFRIFQRYGRR